MKICLMTDSASDLTHELAKECDVVMAQKIYIVINNH